MANNAHISDVMRVMLGSTLEIRAHDEWVEMAMNDGGWDADFSISLIVFAVQDNLLH